MTDNVDPSPASNKSSLAHRLGQWLLDDEKKEADLGRLMKYNILISFLTFSVVAGDAGLAARLLTLLTF